MLRLMWSRTENLKRSKATVLGLDYPPSICLRATEVIELRFIRCRALKDVKRVQVVRLCPDCPRKADTPGCPLRARSGNSQPRSITSSAMAISVGGTVRPSALAVLRLIARVYLVGACTGRSDGISPFNIRSTQPAARRTARRLLLQSHSSIWAAAVALPRRVMNSCRFK